jgi:hypothetical protein
MARGPARAPTLNAFRGQVGATRTRTVHVTTPAGDLAIAQVHVAIDVVADPELGRRLLADDPQRALNTVRLGDGTLLRLDVPLVYHDPATELFVLVLAEGERHRELAERARLLTELSAEPVAVPAYVRDFGVVFGIAGLRAYLESRAELVLEKARAAESARDLDAQRGLLERRRLELQNREAEVERVRADNERTRAENDRLRSEHERARAELDRARAELDRARADNERTRLEIERLRADVDRRALEIAAERDHLERRLAEVARPRPDTDTGRSPVLDDDPALDSDGEPTDPAMSTRVEGPPPRPRGTPPLGVPDAHDDITNRFATLALEPAPPELPAGADPITTEQRDVPAAGADSWLDQFAAGTAAWSATVDGVGVRLALRATGATAAALARGHLDVRLQLIRASQAPLVAVTIGTPQALRGIGAPVWATALLDPDPASDRAVVEALARDFTITVDLLEGSRRVRRTVLNAPLTENAEHVLRAADAHRRASGELPDSAVDEARALVLVDGYDLLGRRHPEASEFRDDKLRQLGTANQVRRALAIARRFARPTGEDYLITVRGYPVARWRELRRAALERAVAWGIWMGGELAQVAVAEGLARSRKDLIQKMVAAFAATSSDPTTGDLDPDAAADNRAALAEEAAALGMAAPSAVGRSRAIASEQLPVVSGTIDRPPAPAPLDPRTRSVDDLIALLEDRDQRLAAAIELCERADPRAIRPVLQAARRMARADAVRVLGASVRFGEAAAPALTAGLASSKAFLRHGCALALALLRTEAGTEAVIDLLLSEPTEIWREVARAVGQVGPTALGALAGRLARIGEAPGADERIAWAMAHVAVRGGQPAVEALAGPAGGPASRAATVAQLALELVAPASRDQVRVRASSPGETELGVREITVNRAFSRRFFEAADRGIPGVAVVELEALEKSGPMELPAELLAEVVDDEDVIDASDLAEEAELDESDIVYSS